MDLIVLIVIGLVAAFAGQYRSHLPAFLGAHIRLINAALTAILPQIEGTENEKDLAIIIVGLILTYLFPNDEAAKAKIYGRRGR